MVDVQITPSLTSIFPLEIIEHIIDFHAEELPLDKPGYGFRYNKPLPTMRALLQTSRQLRILALRHLCRHIVMYYGANARYMDRLREILIPATPNAQLGTIAPYIKSLRVVFSPRHYDLAAWYAPTAQIDNDMLETIRDQSPLSTLSVEFSPDDRSGQSLVEWDQSSPRFRQIFKTFLKLPLLKNVNFTRVINLDVVIFHDASLRELALQSVSFSGKICNPHISSLVIRDTMNNLENITLPNLKRLVISTQTMSLLWRKVTGCWRNMTSLEIYESMSYTSTTHIIPASLSLNMLPLLERFTYQCWQGKAISPPGKSTVFPMISFFQVRESAPALTYLKITVLFNQLTSTEYLRTPRAPDPSWRILDHLLVGGCFPNLGEFHLCLKQCMHVPEDEEESGEAEYLLPKLREQICDELRLSFSNVEKSSIQFKPQSLLSLTYGHLPDYHDIY